MGGVQGDHGREITGEVDVFRTNTATGAFVDISNAGDYSNGANKHGIARFVVSRVIPTGPAFAPRRWGALVCAYLGQPAS